MKLQYKILLGLAVVAIAGAVNASNDFALGPTSWREREALSLCQQTNSAFVRFLASDRNSCYSRLRIVIGLHTALSGRRDDDPQRLAEGAR